MKFFEKGSGKGTWRIWIKGETWWDSEWPAKFNKIGWRNSWGEPFTNASNSGGDDIMLFAKIPNSVVGSGTDLRHIVSRHAVKADIEGLKKELK